MIKLTALKPLSGDYGRVRPGDAFEVSDESTAESLESRGLAERYREAKQMPAPANKMMPEAENKTAFFRRNRAAR